MLEVKLERRVFIWFCAGFALGAILAASYTRVRYIPLGIAFGALCFGCGALLASFLSWQRRQVELENRQIEVLESALRVGKSIEEGRKKLEEEKEEFEDEKAIWEIEHGEEAETPTEAGDQDEPSSG